MGSFGKNAVLRDRLGCGEARTAGEIFEVVDFNGPWARGGRARVLGSIPDLRDLDSLTREASVERRFAGSGRGDSQGVRRKGFDGLMHAAAGSDKIL